MQDQSKACASTKAARRTPCFKSSVPCECGMRGAIASRRPDERAGCAPDQKAKAEDQRLSVLATRKPSVSNRTLIWRLTRTAARTSSAVVAPGTAADDPEAWIAAREPR